MSADRARGPLRRGCPPRAHPADPLRGSTRPPATGRRCRSAARVDAVADAAPAQFGPRTGGVLGDDGVVASAEHADRGVQRGLLPVPVAQVDAHLSLEDRVRAGGVQGLPRGQFPEQGHQAVERTRPQCGDQRVPPVRWRGGGDPEQYRLGQAPASEVTGRLEGEQSSAAVAEEGEGAAGRLPADLVRQPAGQLQHVAHRRFPQTPSVTGQLDGVRLHPVGQLGHQRKEEGGGPAEEGQAVQAYLGVRSGYGSGGPGRGGSGGAAAVVCAHRTVLECGGVGPAPGTKAGPPDEGLPTVDGRPAGAPVDGRGPKGDGPVPAAVAVTVRAPGPVTVVRPERPPPVGERSARDPSAGPAVPRRRSARTAA